MSPPNRAPGGERSPAVLVGAGSDSAPTLADALGEAAFPAVPGARSPAAQEADGAGSESASRSVERWELKQAARETVTYVREHDRKAVQAEFKGSGELPFYTPPSDRRADGPPCRVVTGTLPADAVALPRDGARETVAHAEKMVAAIRAIEDFVEYITPDDRDIEWVPQAPTPTLVVDPATE